MREKTGLEKTRVDNSLLLNNYESTYLNAIFKDSLNGFDFHGKKIGFIRNGGNGKVHYFDMQKRHIIDKKLHNDIIKAIYWSDYKTDSYRCPNNGKKIHFSDLITTNPEFLIRIKKS